ncbi:MAG TPA: thioredoxin domain-containing protein [Pyrinomonadaceae bacterium]|jgi:protein-disulfide isomerase|nr:thioredoxin domain-containing protein [Pyrinomonadaceae bacterium]
MSPKPNAAPKNRYLPFVIIGAVLVAALLALLWLTRSDGESPAANTPNANANQRAASNAPNVPAGPRRGEQPGAPNPHFRGGASAPVTLEEFGDFQCPPCGRLYASLKKIEHDYGDRLKVVFRNYPLQQMHKNAFSAARAAEAAGLQGKFFEMHDLLYENQTEWGESPEPRPIYTDYANRIGLNVEKFLADMARQDVADRIQADFNRGSSLGVRGTPTVFLNGRELNANDTLDDQKLRAQIDAAFAAVGGK